MPPTPKAQPPDPGGPDAPDPVGARLDQIEAKIDDLGAKIEAFENLQLPTPEALEELDLRLTAVEGRPEAIDYGIRDDDEPQRRVPAAKVCVECGGPEAGPHFDDCSIGFGDDALPKTTAERAALERRQEATR